MSPSTFSSESRKKPRFLIEAWFAMHCGMAKVSMPMRINSTQASIDGLSACLHAKHLYSILMIVLTSLVNRSTKPRNINTGMHVVYLLLVTWSTIMKALVPPFSSQGHMYAVIVELLCHLQVSNWALLRDFQMILACMELKFASCQESFWLLWLNR